MKLSIILQEVILPTNLKILLGRLKDQGYTMLGSGDNGIALQKGNQVLKLTTDIDELEHAKKLLNHSFTSVIPIKKVEILGPKSGVIEMVDAQPLAQEEKQELNANSNKAEDYLIYGGELSDSLSDKLKEFLTSLKEAFTKSGIDTDEIDWSSNNVMNFQGRYVLVDV
jgi:hypothetical protein